MIRKLPKSPEAYIQFALENLGKDDVLYYAVRRTSENLKARQIKRFLKWIEYTIDSYPEYFDAYQKTNGHELCIFIAGVPLGTLRKISYKSDKTLSTYNKVLEYINGKTITE